MSDIYSLSKPSDPPRRKPYKKPIIEKINLVPNEAVLGSLCLLGQDEPCVDELDQLLQD
jgi:hypothetical protein